jgi:hypothetical protein
VSHLPADYDERVRAALAGAVVGERLAGTPTGAAQLLDLADSAAQHGYEAEDLKARGLDTPPPAGLAALPLRAVVYGLLTPLDRPLLRRSAYRSAHLAGADEGTAKTAVAAAVLAADLLRFDLDWCLARLQQTLLEEAPLALLQRLRPLPDDAPLRGDTDPGAALQIAITALHRADTPQAVLDELQSYGEDLGVAVSLAAALAGARDGEDDALREGLSPRVEAAAAALVARGRAAAPSQSPSPATIESLRNGHD